MRRREAGLVLSAAVLSSCGWGSRKSALPELGKVPPFEFIGIDGKPFSSRELEGKVWVVDFFFTNCPGPCPRMSKQLRQLQQNTASLQDLRIVSITVDPARDTPEALAAYAKRYEAERSRWFFLTGRKDLIGNLMSEAFYLGFADSMQEHSTKFVLVDRQMRIRGFYDSFDAPDKPGENIAKLISDIKDLHDHS